MNKNRILLDDWSNPATRRKYEERQVHVWPDHFDEGIRRCSACSFFAPLKNGFGLCCFDSSEFYTETLDDDFTCERQVLEGNGVHSFSADQSRHCKCQGSSREVYEDILMRLNKRYEAWKEVREQDSGGNA